MGTELTSALELRLVVAGHTNVGKTTLLRTLGRSAEFGEVSASPSTTRQIHPLTLVSTPELRVTAFDTPGLESSGRLRELLEQETHGRHDRPAVIRQVLDSAEAREHFEQDLRVLRQVMDSDVCLYVVDAREPVLEKYLDEIFVLALCGRPVLPLLNFTATPSSREQQWRDALAKLGQHTVVSFDAVVYSWEAERRLYRNLCTVHPRAEAALEGLIRVRGEESDWRLRGAARALADALIDLAACEDTAPMADAQAIDAAVSRIKQYAREREERLVQDILRAFNYAPEVTGQRLHSDYADGGWRHDPFSEDTLKYYGIRSLGPIAAGAATGGTVDVLAGGTTLGTGVALGAMAGLAVGARSAMRRAHRKLVSKRETLCVDDAVIRLVATRNLQLIASLQSRGHGSQQRLEPMAPGDMTAFRRATPRPLLQARDHHGWSDYPSAPAGSSAGREQTVERLQQQLLEQLRRSQG
ncbi:MAG: DUF3482 domain-containing protein [Ectothiorhodospiraceae bacterium]|nr:DUF3482 domain-containing protein [Ectothiorhodospiraceae bacterium]